MRILLYPFSLMYGAIMRLRNFMYQKEVLKTYRAKIPVISVGNISTGGTGKTPVSMYLLDYYFNHLQKKVSYLSRGYGRKSHGLLRVEGNENSQMYGDEALMVFNRFPQIPVIVSESRKEGLEVLENETDIVILDDAFQHRKVDRDLDILVIDANRLPVGDRILPAGNLREPLSGIRRADLLIINKVSDPAEIPHIRQRLEIFQKPMAFCTPQLTQWRFFAEHKNRSIAELKEKSVCVFSGIGNPQAFEETLKASGIHILHHQIFRDHHPYQKADFEFFFEAQHSSEKQPFCLLTTEKDYFRLKNQSWIKEISNIPLAFVQMELNWWEGEKLLLEMLPK
ncbi:MAG: tetraacyldisaccharide 4'-kinase [Bacteroidetes bacterium]|nr:tetraacyldisaccharide 4'-kinase [Bacteroidota bacterium]